MDWLAGFDCVRLNGLLCAWLCVCCCALQPGTDIYLDSGDTGMLGGKYGIRTYGVSVGRQPAGLTASLWSSHTQCVKALATRLEPG